MLMKLTLGRTGGFDDMAVTFSVKEEGPKSVCGGSLCPNRGAAAQKDAVKRCLGCRQILKLLPFNFFFTTKGGPNRYFSQVRVPPNFILTGCLEPKKVEKHCPGIRLESVIDIWPLIRTNERIWLF